MNGNLFEILQTPAPRFSQRQVSGLLEEHYGIAADLEPLSSERDQNFLVTAADGSKHVLKIANAAESAAVTDFQNQGLAHVARVAADLPVPDVVPTRAGRLTFEAVSERGVLHRSRLLSWLEGMPLQQADGVASVASRLGSTLASLDLALGSFEHPAGDYLLLWDIGNAAHLADLLPHVRDVDLQTKCHAHLERYTDTVHPKQQRCRRQVIYNDMNHGNVLVNPKDPERIAGIIDFGDMVTSQLVNDVAIAAAYLCRTNGDPFIEVREFLAAYSAVLPLAEEEIALLPELILTRHLTTVMISHWRASLYPDNREYILRSEAKARRMLLNVAGKPTSRTTDEFFAVCHSGKRKAAHP